MTRMIFTRNRCLGLPPSVWFSVLLLSLFCLIAASGAPRIPELQGRLIAVGIPGVSGISAVGTFHEGGPIHDKPAFRAFTESNAILDPARILVTSTSNFGAPPGQSHHPSGAVLSLDPRGKTLLQIPPQFATSGQQASALDGQLMLFAANSPAFMNRVYNADAVTANLPAVTSPTAISINNAFGRIWVTGRPFGSEGDGIQSILDPDGRPLNNAPDKTAGGVFSGNLTNRAPQQIVDGAMASGALATALLGKSPDGGGRAVFAGLHADGSVVQIHAEMGVDGLAPPHTIKTTYKQVSIGRGGMVFNWVPNPILYVAEPGTNSIVALSLRADGKVFRLDGSRRITAPELKGPIDIAPAVAEIANPQFSSNTTLAGASDIYVANRGNGTIVRLSQNGTVVAVRRVSLPGIGPLGADRLNGIAVSPDASHLWVTVSGKLAGYPEGAVVELPVFGASGNPEEKR